MKATALSRELPGRSLVVLAYVIGFFGLLPAALFCIGGRFDELLGLGTFPLFAPFGLLVFSFGAAFMLVSMVGLSVRGRGLPISHLPPVALVTEGPYSYFRHPIYVGYTVAFAGLGLSIGSLGIGIGASALLGIGAVILALGFEEPRLVRRHGERFAGYARAVPLFPGSWLLADVGVRAWRRVSPAFQALADRPVLFRLGPTLWVTFGLFAGLGAFLATTFIAASLAPSFGSDPANAIVLGVTAMALVGAWLAARLYRFANLVKRPREELRRVGFVSWGGYVGVMGCIHVAAHALGMPLLHVLDVALPASLLASAIGRLGCLSYGCCGGRPSEHGIRWRCPEARIVRELGEVGSVPRVPAQLLSSLHALATFALVSALAGRARPGMPTLLVLIGYSLGRFAIELLRDEPRFTRFELTRGQMASGALFAIALVLLFFLPAEGIAATFHLRGASPFTLIAPFASGALTFVVCGIHLRRVGSY